jgi:hypothetical protein
MSSLSRTVQHHDLSLKTLTVKPCIRWDRLSNQEKAELFSDSFGIRSFQGCHGEISPRDQFMPKGLICPEFPISANQPYSDSRNSEIADHLESDNEPSESSESYLTGWYLAIRGVSVWSRPQIWLFSPAAVLSTTNFSIVVNTQNSVTSKWLVRRGWISNQWKDERVVYIFSIQLRGRIQTKQPQILFFLSYCILPRNAVFSHPPSCKKS